MNFCFLIHFLFFKGLESSKHCKIYVLHGKGDPLTSLENLFIVTVARTSLNVFFHDEMYSMIFSYEDRFTKGILHFCDLIFRFSDYISFNIFQDQLPEAIANRTYENVLSEISSKIKKMMGKSEFSLDELRNRMIEDEVFSMLFCSVIYKEYLKYCCLKIDKEKLLFYLYKNKLETLIKEKKQLRKTSIHGFYDFEFFNLGTLQSFLVKELDKDEMNFSEVVLFCSPQYIIDNFLAKSKQKNIHLEGLCLEDVFHGNYSHFRSLDMIQRKFSKAINPNIFNKLSEVIKRRNIVLEYCFEEPQFLDDVFVWQHYENHIYTSAKRFLNEMNYLKLIENGYKFINKAFQLLNTSNLYDFNAQIKNWKLNNTSLGLINPVMLCGSGFYDRKNEDSSLTYVARRFYIKLYCFFDTLEQEDKSVIRENTCKGVPSTEIQSNPEDVLQFFEKHILYNEKYMNILNDFQKKGFDKLSLWQCVSEISENLKNETTEEQANFDDVYKYFKGINKKILDIICFWRHEYMEKFLISFIASKPEIFYEKLNEANRISNDEKLNNLCQQTTDLEIKEEAVSYSSILTVENESCVSNTINKSEECVSLEIDNSKTFALGKNTKKRRKNRFRVRNEENGVPLKNNEEIHKKNIEDEINSQSVAKKIRKKFSHINEPRELESSTLKKHNPSEKGLEIKSKLPLNRSISLPDIISATNNVKNSYYSDINKKYSNSMKNRKINENKIFFLRDSFNDKASGYSKFVGSLSELNLIENFTEKDQILAFLEIEKNSEDKKITTNGDKNVVILKEIKPKSEKENEEKQTLNFEVSKTILSQFSGFELVKTKSKNKRKAKIQKKTSNVAKKKGNNTQKSTLNEKKDESNKNIESLNIDTSEKTQQDVIISPSDASTPFSNSEILFDNHLLNNHFDKDNEDDGFLKVFRHKQPQERTKLLNFNTTKPYKGKNDKQDYHKVRDSESIVKEDCNSTKESFFDAIICEERKPIVNLSYAEVLAGNKYSTCHVKKFEQLEDVNTNSSKFPKTQIDQPSVQLETSKDSVTFKTSDNEIIKQNLGEKNEKLDYPQIISNQIKDKSTLIEKNLKRISDQELIECETIQKEEIISYEDDMDVSNLGDNVLIDDTLEEEKNKNIHTTSEKLDISVNLEGESSIQEDSGQNYFDYTENTTIVHNFAYYFPPGFTNIIWIPYHCFCICNTRLEERVKHIFIPKLLTKLNMGLKTNYYYINNIADIMQIVNIENLCFFSNQSGEYVEILMSKRKIPCTIIKKSKFLEILCYLRNLTYDETKGDVMKEFDLQLWYIFIEAQNYPINSCVFCKIHPSKIFYR